MLVLFVISIFVLTGITAIVVDVSWYWANTLRVQRAADAAALAGVVWLPGAPGSAFSTARATATQNGYTDGVGRRDHRHPAGSREQPAPVGDHHGARQHVLHEGVRDPAADRLAAVEGGVRPAGSDGQPRELLRQLRAHPRPDLLDDVDPDRPQLLERRTRAGRSRRRSRRRRPGPHRAGRWSTRSATNDNIYAQTTTANAVQQWSTFGLDSGLAANQTITAIDGIEVRLSDTFLSAALREQHGPGRPVVEQRRRTGRRRPPRPAP